jgi:hypothetical protein
MAPPLPELLTGSGNNCERADVAEGADLAEKATAEVAVLVFSVLSA